MNSNSVRPDAGLRLKDLLDDPDARWALKDEVVAVTFAASAGVVRSGVGDNQYVVGDALLTAGGGESWSVARARFDAKYLPLSPTQPGADGFYRNRPLRVRAKRMGAAFVIRRGVLGDVLEGRAGDWLVQYAPGDFGIVAQARFAAVYRLLA